MALPLRDRAIARIGLTSVRNACFKICAACSTSFLSWRSCKAARSTMADWIKAGGSLPNIPELISELSAPTYFFHNGKFQIESKDQIKKRLGKSPDLADALALTFAIPDQPGGMLKLPGAGKRSAPKEYDPYALI